MREEPLQEKYTVETDLQEVIKGIIDFERIKTITEFFISSKSFL